MTTLEAAAANFVTSYHSDRALVDEQQGWSPVIALIADDTGDAVTLALRDGQVAEIFNGRAAREVNVEIRSDHATLCDILELRRGPNEPYLFGELTVQGPEADFVRLDYIVSRLCPV